MSEHRCEWIVPGNRYSTSRTCSRYAADGFFCTQHRNVALKRQREDEESTRLLLAQLRPTP